MKLMVKILAILILMLSIFLPFSLFSATYTSNASGDWYTDGNWDLAGSPGAGDIVIIQAAHSITLSSTTTTSEVQLAGTLVVNNAVTLNCSSSFTQSAGSLDLDGTLSVTNDLIQSGGSMDIANGASLSSADLTVVTMTLNAGGSINCTNFVGSGTIDLSGTSTISNNFTISGSAAVNLGANLTVSGNLILTAGTIALGANQLTLSSGITYTAGKINASNSASTIVIGAAGPASLNSNWFTSTSIGNLTINRAMSLSGTFNVGGQLNLSGGDITISGANSLTLNQDIAGGKDIIANGSSSIYLQGATSWNANNVLNGISALNNLTINLSHATNKTIATSNDLAIGGTLTLSSGYFDITGDALTLNADVSAAGRIIADNTSSLILQGSSSWTSTRILTSITALNNLTINLTHATNKTIATNNDFEVAGTLTLTNGFLDISGDELNLNADVSSGGKITTNNSSSLVLQGNSAWTTDRILNSISALNNLTININNASNTIATNTNLIIYGSLTISNGTLDISGDQLTLYDDVNAGGNITTNSSSSLVLTGANAWGANTILTGISALNNLSINLTNAGNNTINQVAATLTMAGNLTVSSGTFSTGTNTLNIAGDITLSGTAGFSMSEAGTIDFNGTSDITNSGTGEIVFGSVTVVAAKTVTTNTDIEIKDDITVNTNSSFTASSGTISLNGSDAVGIANSGALDFYNLEVKTSSSGCTPTTGFTIDGSLFINNTFNPSAGTITFGGSAAQHIFGTSEPVFYNLSLNNSSGLVLHQNIRFIASAQSTLTISSGDIDLNGPYLIYFQNATDKLSETAGNNIVNTGSTATGYLTTTSNISTANLTTASLGLSLTGPTNLTVRLYPKTACNDGIPSVKRYFMVNYTGTITAMTLGYDNTELYGTASNLAAYSSGNITDWERHESTATAGTNTGSVTATNDLTLDNPVYFALFTRARFFSNDGGNGLWSQEINWKDSLKPEEDDVVVIGSYTVLIDEDIRITDLVLSKSDTYLKPKSTGTYNLTLLGNLTCGGTDCAEPSSDKFNGTNGSGRVNVIFDNESQKTITTYQDGELVFYNLKITDESDVTTSGNYRVDVTGDLVVEGTGSFTPANGTNINFYGARHLSEGTIRNKKREQVLADYLSSPGEQTIENPTNGTLTFGTVTIATGSQVTTSSDFSVTNLFEVQSGGSFIADSGTIIFNGSPVTITKSSDAIMKFNKIVNSGSLSTDASFYVKDDFTTSGAFTQTDGEVTFQNNGSYAYPRQIINTNSSAIRFATLIIEDGSYISTSSDLTIADDVENYLEVKGNGYFKCTGTTTIGAAGATGTTIITKANEGTIEFRDLTMANVVVTCSTASDLKINGDFTVNINASFLATAPSNVTFRNDRTSGLVQSISGASTNKTFSSMTVDDITTLETSTSFTLTGDLRVNGNGSLTASTPSTIVFDGGTSKSIVNKGNLEFYNLTLASASSGNNSLTTESDFVIANEFRTQGNSNNGSIKASGESTITLGNGAIVTNPLTSVTGEGGSIEFMNLKIPAGATQNISSSFKLKGDLINEGTLTATSGTLHFIGNRKQKLLGSNAPTLFSVNLSNPFGLEMDNSFSYANGGAGLLTLTSGSIDLGGNNTITMSSNSATLTETAGNVIKNTKESDGGATGGYITSAQIASAALVDDCGIGLDITGSNATNITVKRYHRPLNINDNSGVSRYYEADFTNNITSATMTLDDSELNSNTNDELTLFMSDSDASSSWTSVSTTFTDGDDISSSGYLYYGNQAISGLVSGYYFTLSPKNVSIQSLLVTGIIDANKISESPLYAGSTSQIIYGFSILSTSDINYLEKIVIDFTEEFSNSLSNLSLRYDTDNDLTTNGKTNTNASNSISGSRITFLNINLSLTANQRYYFFVIANVKNTVTNSTKAITAVLTSDDIYVTDTKISEQRLTGNRLSFSEHLLTVDNKNMPASDALVKAGGSYEQIVYGFRINQEENAPSFTFNSVKLKAENTNNQKTEFYDFKLWIDQNKNGRKDAADANIGSTISKFPSDGYISFSSLSQSISSDAEFLVTCKVSDTSETNGSIRLKIEYVSDINIDYPVNISNEGPFIGRKMYVIEKVTATNLDIINISPATAVEGYGNKDVISGLNVSITVVVKDDSGNLQPVDENTQVQISVKSGNSTIGGTYTQTLSANDFEKTWNTLTITNTSGEEDLEISAKAVSGQTLRDAELSGIKVHPAEPTSSPSNLQISNVTYNSVDLSWTAGSPSNHIVVLRKDNLPVAPSNTVEYETVSGNDISGTINIENQTTKGSIVVYKGPNTNVTVRGLESGEQYYFSVYSYNGTGLSSRYRTDANTGDYLVNADTTTKETDVSVPTSNLSFDDIGDDFLTLSWTPGSGERRIVLCRKGSAVSTSPTDATHYPKNTIFGIDSTKIGSSYVVYNGTGSSRVTVTGLGPNTSYHFAIFEYNGSYYSSNYMSSSVTTNRSTLKTEPVNQASDISFTATENINVETFSSDNQIKVNWKNGNGDGRIVLAKVDSPISNDDLPHDGTGYYSLITGETAFGDYPIGNAVVVYNGTGSANSATVTSISKGRVYYFKVVEYNGSGTTISSNTNVNYNTGDARYNPNSYLTDRYEDNNSMINLEKWKYISSDETSYTGYINYENDEDWLYLYLDFANSKKNTRLKLTDLPENYAIELYNASGRLLRRSNNPGLIDEYITINNLPQGIYFIRIYANSGVYNLSPYNLRAESKSLNFFSNE